MFKSLSRKLFQTLLMFTINLWNGFVKNAKAAFINDALLLLFEGEEINFSSIDCVVNENDTVHYSTTFLNILKPLGFHNHQLLLHVIIPKLLLKNLKLYTFCNDTRLQVNALHRNVVEAIVITRIFERKILFILRTYLILNVLPFPFERLQFPLELYFTMMINKSQRQTTISMS